MAQTLLALRDISVRYGAATVLEIAELDIHAGEILAVIGPNGAGKSTLLRVIALLQQPATGKVLFEGVPATRQNALDLRRQMASVFQQPLLINASVYDNAALGLRLRGLNAATTARRLNPWLERFGIDHLAARPARSLSGGEAQRTSLVRALALEPKLLLLDEPFSALDPMTRETLLLDLQNILNETGITAVFVTHDRSEAFMLGQRVGVLKAGRLLQLGSNLEVFSRPASQAVADIVGVENRLAGVVECSADEGATIRFNGGPIHVSARFEPGAKVMLFIRPEDITLVRADDGKNSAAENNCLQAKLVSASPWMFQYRITLDCCGTPLTAIVDRRSWREFRLAVGDALTVSFHPAAVHVILSD